MGSKHIGLFPDAEHTFWFVDPPQVVVGAGIQHIWLLTEDGVTVDLSALHQQLRVIMTSTDVRCPQANDEPISASQRNE